MIIKRKFEILKKKSDLIIVSDYGHGFITKKISKLINNSKKFTALNAQINANNIGYHSLKNYKKIDFVIINERELRHELRDRNSNLKFLIKKFSEMQSIKDLIVTRGSKGALLYSRQKKSFFQCPAFADKVLDKVGSGDSMLTQSSITLQKSQNRNLSLLLGSLAAVESIKDFGNKNILNKKIF